MASSGSLSMPISEDQATQLLQTAAENLERSNKESGSDQGLGDDSRPRQPPTYWRQNLPLLKVLRELSELIPDLDIAMALIERDMSRRARRIVEATGHTLVSFRCLCCAFSMFQKSLTLLPFCV